MSVGTDYLSWLIANRISCGFIFQKVIGCGAGKREVRTPNPRGRAAKKRIAHRARARICQRQRAKFLSFFVPWIPSWRMRLWLYAPIGINITGQGNYIGRECYLDTEYPELITIEPGSKLSPRVIIFCHFQQQRFAQTGKAWRGFLGGCGCDYWFPV